jgi:hypothetical protein
MSRHGSISPDQLQHTLIRSPQSEPTHEEIRVDAVEKLRQVNIHPHPLTRLNIGLGLRYRLMGRTSRPKALAVLGEAQVPARLEYLQDRLLGKPIDDTRDTQLALLHGLPRLGDLYPLHRARSLLPF